MPVGPLALADEVSLALMLSIQRQTEADLGAAYRPRSSTPIVRRMVEDEGRPGKAAGRGFYEYPANGRKRLWPGLERLFPLRPPDPPSAEDIADRYLYVQALEAVRCWEDGVVESPGDADLGSVLGWGFAPFTGGVLSFLEHVGLETALRRAEELEARFGERFRPPARLRALTEHGEGLYSDSSG